MAAKPKAVLVVGVIAVAIAAVASYYLWTYLQGQEERFKQAGDMEKVIVAAEEIPVGSTIKITQVKAVDWPKANIPQGKFASPDQVTGRVALQKLLMNDAVVEAKLLPKEGGGNILSYKIPEGHRAMTVGVDQVSGVAGFVTPGNLVDIVLTTTPIGSQQPISKIVLQNVPVLAIAQIVEEKEGKPVVVPTVTMDVTPDDAEKLAIASTQGRLQLILRRVGDKEVTATTGTTVSKVIGAPVAVKRAAPMKKTGVVSKKTVAQPVVMTPTPSPRSRTVTVEVIRGSAKTTDTFVAE